MTKSFIAIICGLKSEAQAVSSVLDASKIHVGVSGANAQRAENIARKFCEDGASAIISVGVSGGLDPALKPGDMIIGESIIADDGSVYESDRSLLDCIISAHPGPRTRPLAGPRINSGRDPEDRSTRSPLIGLLAFANGRGNERKDCLGSDIKMIAGRVFGSDEIIDSAYKKAALFQKYRCLAVDMESHGAARPAKEAGVPFLAIRAIADPADRALPPAALGAVAPDGSTRMLATLGAALRDPKQFPALLKLGADSDAALKTLRHNLGPLFNRLFLRCDL